jgi:hypothetical protein
MRNGVISDRNRLVFHRLIEVAASATEQDIHA